MRHPLWQICCLGLTAMCRRIEYANRWAAFSAWQQSQVAAPSQAALEHLGRSGALGTNPTTPKRTRSVGVQNENLGGTVMTKDFRFLAKHGVFLLILVQTSET